MASVKSMIFWALATAVIYKALVFVVMLDLTKKAYNHKPGTCKNVEGIEFGSEDIQVLPSGLAFISSGLRFDGMNNDDLLKRKGAIFLFDFKKPAEKVQELEIQGEKFDKETFNPHGISVWQNPTTGETTLFVINHVVGEHCVEKFSFDAAALTLKHQHNITSPAFRYINDLVALSENTFYISNALYYNNFLPEVLLSLSWGSVVYYDGQEGHVVASGLNGANGVNKKGQFLYVAAALDKRIHVYHVEADFNLTLSQTLSVGSACDNIDVAIATGDLWLGCHPILYNFNSHAEYPSHNQSPSQVLRLKVKDDGSLDDTITEVYCDDGSTFSASSVAINYDNKLLVGSVFTRLLLCDIAHI